MKTKFKQGLKKGPNFIDVSTQGYQTGSPDFYNENNLINSGRITMRNVPFPIMGEDNLGNRKMMMPNQEYQFPGSQVMETPMMQGGGTPYTDEAMMKIAREKIQAGNMSRNPAIRRMFSPPSKEDSYLFDNGNYGTHYMSSMDNFAVPQIQSEKGVLNLGNYGPNSNESIRFDNSSQAEWFGQNYKRVSPGFDEYEELELTDKEIQEYRDGGYVVEELPEAQNGVNIVPLNADGTPYVNLPEFSVTDKASPELRKKRKRQEDLNKKYPYFSHLSKDEKKMFNNKGAIGRGIRAQASQGYGLDGNQSFADSTKDFAMKMFTAGPQGAGDIMQAPQALMVEEIERLRGNDYDYRNTFGNIANEAGISSNYKNRVPSDTFLKDQNEYIKFAGDMFLDPSNLVGGGLFKKGITAPAKFVTAASHIDDAIRGVGNFSKKSITARKIDKARRIAYAEKSTIDWGKWNKSIPKNDELMLEYKEIEKSAKLDGSWMKNDDGTEFMGMPEQFVQISSKNFKKAFSEGYDKTFRGVRDLANETLEPNHSGIGPSIFTSDKKMANYYGEHILELASRKSKKNRIDLNFDGDQWNKLNLDPNLFKDPAIVGRIKRHAAEKKIKNLIRISESSIDFNMSSMKDFGKNSDEYIHMASKVKSQKEVLRKLKKQIADGKSTQPSVKTNDLASYIENEKIDKVRLNNISDGGRGDVTIVNHVKNNYLKSLIGNDGMFDMSNPNVYKAVVPGAAGAGVLGSQEFKDGGEYEELELTDEEIQEYRDGGYVVEEVDCDECNLTKAQDGTESGKEAYQEYQDKISDFYKDNKGYKFDLFKNNLLPESLQESNPNLNILNCIGSSCNAMKESGVDLNMTAKNPVFWENAQKKDSNFDIISNNTTKKYDNILDQLKPGDIFGHNRPSLNREKWFSDNNLEDTENNRKLFKNINGNGIYPEHSNVFLRFEGDYVIVGDGQGREGYREKKYLKKDILSGGPYGNLWVARPNTFNGKKYKSRLPEENNPYFRGSNNLDKKLNLKAMDWTVGLKPLQDQNLDEDQWNNVRGIMKSVITNRDKFINASGISPDKYDNIMQYLPLIANQESDLGNAIGLMSINKGNILRGAFEEFKTTVSSNPSEGLLQVKHGSVFANRNTKKLANMMGITKDNYDPSDVNQNSIISMILINDKLKNVDLEFKKNSKNNQNLTDIEKLLYYYNRPGTIRSGNAQGDNIYVKNVMNGSKSKTKAGIKKKEELKELKRRMNFGSKL